MWGEDETTLACEAPPNQSQNRNQIRKWHRCRRAVGRWGSRVYWGRNRRCVPNACGSVWPCPRPLVVRADQGHRLRSPKSAESALGPHQLRWSNSFRPETRACLLPHPADRPWREGERHNSSESMPSSVDLQDNKHKRDVRTNCPMVLHRSK